MVHVCIAFRVMNSVITEIPCSTIVDHLLTGNQGVDFLNISLEVTEVLECLILSYDRVRILIEPVCAGSDGYTSGQQEQRGTEKGFDVIEIFHISIHD
jgi:hypothetical protein